jgi:hypothetical protein
VDSRFSKDHVKDATELCIRNTIYLSIRVSNKESLWLRWYSLQESTPLIRNTREITSKSGTTDKESFMTECGLLTSLFTRLRMPIMVFGHLSSQKPTLTNQVLSTIHTTC